MRAKGLKRVKWGFVRRSGRVVGQRGGGCGGRLKVTILCPMPQVGVVPRVAVGGRVARERGARAAQPEPLRAPAAAAAARLRRYVQTHITYTHSHVLTSLFHTHIDQRDSEARHSDVFLVVL